MGPKRRTIRGQILCIGRNIRASCDCSKRRQGRRTMHPWGTFPHQGNFATKSGKPLTVRTPTSLLNFWGGRPAIKSESATRRAKSVSDGTRNSGGFFPRKKDNPKSLSSLTGFSIDRKSPAEM